MGSITPEPTIPLGLHLWTRIRQQGTRSVMGVPGDMNLELLDYIKQVSGLKWGQYCGFQIGVFWIQFAHDGYARVKDCPGVITTTMGVGEMSALNGIAGAYTEQVKTGQIFDKISTHVRCAHAWIDDPHTAPAEIDRVIWECWLRSMPVYIFVLMDFVHHPVPAKHLDKRIDLSYPVNAINEAKKPVVLVDGLIAWHSAIAQARELLHILNFPVFAAPMGKGVVDETASIWCGIYSGEVSLPVYFGSIGYSVGACLGAALAQREIKEERGMQNGRTILIVGDGSLQLTVQEIATMIRHRLALLLLVINNNGFAIERAIYGPDEEYNDISSWNHQVLLEAFGEPSG
ncbi:hypothetical protein F66182_11825 [Fusarium sp. NRRL 66182]|nr:hypothetical protein F66182_11825 [Fusarium sp. NRRL 66182]